MRSSAENWARNGFWLFASIHLLLWTVISIWIQPNPPLDAVEIVAWGHEWQLGYAKHPPLVAWLAETARLAGGSSPVWSLYLMGQLCVVTAFWAVWQLARDITTPWAALAAALVLEATGRYTWMTLEFNHSLVVLPCVALTTLFLYRALAEQRLRWWIAAGLSFGVGLMAKYTILLQGLVITLFLLTNREARRRAAGIGPWLALGVAMLAVLPHAVWAIVHGLPTVAYVANRGRSGAGLLGHILHPLHFLGMQLLALEFLFVAVLALLVWPVRLRGLDARERFIRQYLFAIAVGPGLALALVSVVTGLRLRPAWGMPLWSALGVLALFCCETRPRDQMLRRAMVASALFGAANVGLALIEGVAGPYVTSRGLRTHFPGRALAGKVVEVWTQRFDAPWRLVVGERWLAGNVAFHAPSRPSVLTNDGPGSSAPDEAVCPWTSIADVRHHGAVLVWSVDREGPDLPPGLQVHFPDAETLPALTLHWQTRAPVKPVTIGIAVVAPRSPTPSRRSGGRAARATGAPRAPCGPRCRPGTA